MFSAVCFLGTPIENWTADIYTMICNPLVLIPNLWQYVW